MKTTKKNEALEKFKAETEALLDNLSNVAQDTMQKLADEYNVSDDDHTYGMGYHLVLSPFFITRTDAGGEKIKNMHTSNLLRNATFGTSMSDIMRHEKELYCTVFRANVENILEQRGDEPLMNVIASALTRGIVKPEDLYSPEVMVNMLLGNDADNGDGDGDGDDDDENENETVQ